MKMKKNKINITVSALFAAMLCVISQMSFLTPAGVPLTFQVFAVALCGYVLGVKWAAASVLTYILSGAVGLPVFSGFKGGAHMLFSPTGGFLWGFILLSILCGLRFKKGGKWLPIIFGICGVLVCHLFGVVQYALTADIGLWAAFVSASLPFLLKDIVLTILAFVISKRIKKGL